MAIPTDLDKLASRIRAPVQSAPTAQLPELMPDYVVPRPEVPPVGTLSAEAIVRDIEKTAKDIEAMATELVSTVAKCASDLTALTGEFRSLCDDVQSIVDHVKITSAGYREEAKKVFIRIEDTTLMMQAVRKLSDEMRQRLAIASLNDPPLGVSGTTGPSCPAGVEMKPDVYPDPFISLEALAERGRIDKRFLNTTKTNQED